MYGGKSRGLLGVEGSSTSVYKSFIYNIEIWMHGLSNLCDSRYGLQSSSTGLTWDLVSNADF